MPRRICTTLKVCSGLPRTLHVFPFCFLLRSPSPIWVRGGAVVLPDPYVGRSPRRPSTEGRSSGFLVRTSCCPSLRRARIFWRHHEQINHVLMQRRQNLTGRCCNCAVSRGLSCSTTVSLLFRFCSPCPLSILSLHDWTGVFLSLPLFSDSPSHFPARILPRFERSRPGEYCNPGCLLIVFPENDCFDGTCSEEGSLVVDAIG